MPTISATLIRAPRVERYCAECRRLMWPHDGPQVRLYGNGDESDPPYVMWLHRACAEESRDPKIEAALLGGAPPATQTTDTTEE